MTHLKESHKTQIKAFFNGCRSNDIQGQKLQALYKLTQLRGEKITTLPKDNKIHGLKALNIGDGFYIAFKYYPIKKDSFFPCRLDLVYMEEL